MNSGGWMRTMALERAPDWLLGLGVRHAGRVLARLRFRPPFDAELARARGDSSRDLEEIKTSQIRTLNDLVHAAYAHSPYYRQAFCAAGWEPGTQLSLTEFSLLPTLHKSDILTCHDEMLTGIDGPVVAHRTSGTTGERLQFMIPEVLRYQVNAAHIYAFYSWFGFSQGDRRVTLGGRYLGTRPRGRVLMNPAEHQLVLSTHGLNAVAARRYASAIKTFKPKAIQGHPTAIARLVELMREEGADTHTVPLVFVTGESLEENVRDRIAEGLSAEVVSTYGSGENVVMAGECPAGGGFHVDESFGYVELVPTESGLYEIVATSLLNRAMPMIRYATGDLTSGWVDGTCPCGRGWRRLRDVIGRADEIVQAPSGRTVLPVEVRTAVSAYAPQAPPYTLVWDRTSGAYELVVYVDGTLNDRERAALLQAVGRVLGQGARISLSARPAKEWLTRGGKHRTVETV